MNDFDHKYHLPYWCNPWSLDKNLHYRQCKNWLRVSDFLLQTRCYDLACAIFSWCHIVTTLNIPISEGGIGSSHTHDLAKSQSY